MTVTLVKQPKGSRVCGQAVVAMILGVDLDEATRLVQRIGGTKAEHLRRALRSRGVVCADRPTLTRYHEIPPRAILRLSRPYGRNWHWMLMWDGTVYDPAECWEQRKANGWEITSFISCEVPNA